MSEEKEPKLIIDEDWKSQVQREKEEAMRKQAAADYAGTAEGASEDVVTSGQSAEGTAAGGGQQLPPASLPMLIASLGTQAMAAMGQLAMADGEQPEVNLDFARHFIDLLGVLEDKTQGNLTPQENSYLQDTLHQLRLAFVEIKARHG